MRSFRAVTRVLGIVFAFTLAVAASGERPVAANGHRSSGQAAAQSPCQGLRIGVADLGYLLGSGDVVVIDVRNPAAYEYSHLRGALSIPIESLPAAALTLKSSGERIVVYGDEPGGDQGARAAGMLRQLGVADAQALDGGLPRWIADGNVIVTQVTPGF